MNSRASKVDTLTAYVVDGDLSVTLPIPERCRVIALAQGIGPVMLPFHDAELTIDPDDGSGVPQGVSYPIVLLIVRETDTSGWTMMDQAVADDIHASVVREWAEATAQSRA
jgi:hypothetical protein